MWNSVITLFREYMGSGLIIGWFLISVLYLLIKEKRKHLRILFLYVPIILLILYFNPLFARLVYGFVGDEIYYRILWLIPITIVIAYAMVQIYGTLKGKIKIVSVLIGIILIMISGTYVYKNIYFSKAENLYHMPQAVVDICDAIEVEGREVMAVFPVEFLQYVRQYSPVVCMPYGREVVVERWGIHNELFDVMQGVEIDAGRLAELAKANDCHYVILPEEKEIIGTLTDYDYVLFDSISGYNIYLDTTFYIGL